MRLLVSVRSAVEAEAALEGGAAVIDVKEPANGSLGRADPDIIAAVVDRVAGRRPLSAALGELRCQRDPYRGKGLSFVKWGLAGYDGKAWREDLAAATTRVVRLSPECQVVTVAYGDWERAGAPSVPEVVAFVKERPGSILLLDTFDKSGGRTLLDCLPVSSIAFLCAECRAASVRVALAGSLASEEIRLLLSARPDWFAVRGAACVGRDRGQMVRADKVRYLARILTDVPEPGCRDGLGCGGL
jgi:uncharacterized protein (UPF0264 family)